MRNTILGARFRWYEAGGWIFDPVHVSPDTIEYTLVEGPHAPRHAIQNIVYNRVAPGIETTAWYEESGAVVHITWYLETRTFHRFFAPPAWLWADPAVSSGDNQDPEFLSRIEKLRTTEQDWPRHIGDDDGYFEFI